MTEKSAPRPGGRSARVQASVHAAAKLLMTQMDRAALTVPAIAAQAGVTPSTIYRRWGDLQQLLADIAVERLRADCEPEDTGSGPGDLLAWAEQYAEEMASGPGREMIRDMLATAPDCRLCSKVTRAQIEIVAARAAARDEPFPPEDAIMDRLVAPIICDILFGRPMEPGRVAALVAETLAVPGDAARA